MPIPVIASRTENTNTGTSIDMARPTGWVSGDVGNMILGDDDNGATLRWTTPTGWNEIIAETRSTEVDCGLYILERVADGTEADPINVVWGGGSDDLWGYWLRLTGVDTTAVVDVVGTPQLPGNQTSHAVPSVTTTVDDCLAFYALAFDGPDGAPFSVSGTGWAEVDEVTSSLAEGTFGTKDQASAGATGIATVTSSVSDGSVYVQWAITGASVAAAFLPIFPKRDNVLLKM